MSLSSHQSAKAKSDEWLTPPEILNALGKFDLDPCAPINAPWPTATRHYTKADDGLSRPWTGRVWLNPPFGREAVKWLRKLAKHGDGIALIPARTETAMFYECVWGVADAVCFLKGRPHFHYVTGERAAANSGAPICLVAYGVKNAKALLEFDARDLCIHRWGSAPCVDLRTREFWAIAECKRCKWRIGDPQSRLPVDWNSLPKIGTEGLAVEFRRIKP